MVRCTNPNNINLLRKTFYYNFGKEQKLNLEVKVESNEKKSNPILTSIGEIVGSENSTKCFQIPGTEEKIEIKAENKKIKKKYLTIHFKLKILSKRNHSEISQEEEEKIFKKEKHKLYFKIKKNDIILYESESFTDDGKFNIIQIPLDIINSDFSIIFFNHKNQNIGEIQTNVNEISSHIEKNNLFFQKTLTMEENLNIYNNSSIRDEITFLDYIKNGVRVALDIGIDFTGSNGHPDDKDTLHCRRLDMKKRNPYERAILACANIIAHYDYDQLFPVYGFGAIIKGQKEKGVSMCFNINFKKDPNIQFVENILKEYYDCLNKIDFTGPTHFAPIINKVISDMKKEIEEKDNGNLEYHVLMILTDGKIEDYEDTVDALVEGSFLPLSVIIIGIEDDDKDDKIKKVQEYDFDFMIKLDGDETPLISRNGKKRQRDLVQFVRFKKLEGDAKKLAEEVLDEIPRQIIEYYTLNSLYPESLKKSNFINNRSKESLKKSNDINNRSKESQNSQLNELNQSNQSTFVFNNPNVVLFNNIPKEK